MLVVEGADENAEQKGESQNLLSMSVEEHVQHYIDSGMSKNDAIKKTAKDRGVHKNEIYQVVMVK